MIVLMVALGAAIGAPARYLTDRAVQTRHDSVMPWGTLLVNVIASLLLGILGGAAAKVSPTAAALVGTGFCGALSTFSTFSYEVIALVRIDRARLAAAYALGSVVVGVLAVALGWAIGSAA